MTIKKFKAGAFGKPVSAFKSYIYTSEGKFETIGDNFDKNLNKVMENFEKGEPFKIKKNFDLLDVNEQPLYMLDEYGKKVLIHKPIYFVKYADYQKNVKLFQTNILLPSLLFNKKLKKILVTTRKLTIADFLSKIEPFIIAYYDKTKPLQIYSYVKEEEYVLYLFVHEDHITYLQFIYRNTERDAYKLMFGLYHIKNAEQSNFFDEMVAQGMKWAKIFDQNMDKINFISRELVDFKDIVHKNILSSPSPRQLPRQSLTPAQLPSPRQSLIHAQSPTPARSPSPRQSPTPVPTLQESLDDMNMDMLKNKARSMGMSGFSRLRKAELINEIISKSAASAASPSALSQPMAPLKRSSRLKKN